MANGYEAEEEETVFGTTRGGKPIVKSKKVKKIHIAPNLGANIFLAKNAYPTMFQELINHNVNNTTNIPAGIDFDNLTDRQKEALKILQGIDEKEE
jgi:hypothetical protein